MTATMTGREFNRQIKARLRDAERELVGLAEIYQKVLAKASRDAVGFFRSETAAAWQPPPDGNLYDQAALAAYATAQLSRAQRKIFMAVAGPPLARAGISWDVTNPFVSSLLDRYGQRTGQALAEAVQPVIRENVMASYEAGLSVNQSADALREKLSELRPAQARMLARTDLNGLANGGSVFAARLVGVQYKQWVTAADDRVREQHVEADGQTVPVDQPFTVCDGQQADFPGDPGLSDDCAINCRCTVVYVDAQEVETAAADNGHAPQPLQVHVAAPTLSTDTTALLEQISQRVADLEDALLALSGPKAVTFTRDDAGRIVAARIDKAR